MTNPDVNQKNEKLPKPSLQSNVSIEEAIHNRRSIRSFNDQQPTIGQIAQLCWAAQGITDDTNQFRAAPSAGALFPTELYIITQNGVHHYDPHTHSLHHHIVEDVRPQLRAAALDQEVITTAPVTFAIASVFDRVAAKYGSRAERYCLIEAGHIAQNVFLQAEALQMAGVAVGAYDDNDAKNILKLPKDHELLYLLPIGFPA